MKKEPWTESEYKAMIKAIRFRIRELKEELGEQVKIVPEMNRVSMLYGEKEALNWVLEYIGERTL